MRKLENLRWSPKWVSHLGCIKGCLDYLELEISDAWLFGGTGHAFIINISEDSCPSGPTAWKTMMLFEQAPRLGYQIEGIFGSKYSQDLEKIQEEAWIFARKSIDAGFPVYCWEVDIPEFYVVFGYDETGYYYSGPNADEGKGPKHWRELGDTGIGIVELYNVKPTRRQDPGGVVRSAFSMVLRHASNPADWIFSKYASGIKGYNKWIKGLETGKANRFGMGYNIAVWSECRHYAVAFLKETRDYLDGAAELLLAEALDHYQVVSDRMKKVTKLYPWEPTVESALIPVDDKCNETITLLKEAREAEKAGLSVLEKIVVEL